MCVFFHRQTNDAALSAWRSHLCKRVMLSTNSIESRDLRNRRDLFILDSYMHEKYAPLAIRRVYINHGSRIDLSSAQGHNISFFITYHKFVGQLCSGKFYNLSNGQHQQAVKRWWVQLILPARWKHRDYIPDLTWRISSQNNIMALTNSTPPQRVSAFFVLPTENSPRLIYCLSLWTYFESTAEVPGTTSLVSVSTRHPKDRIMGNSLDIHSTTTPWRKPLTLPI